MTDKENTSSQVHTDSGDDFDTRVDRCLSMVLHQPEVQEIAAIVKRVHAERQQGTNNAE